MQGRGIRFAGIQKNEVQVIDLQVGRVAPVRRNTLEVKGRPGGISQGYDIGIRTITAVVEFESFSKAGWLENFDEISAWLTSEDPQELEFEHEPGRMYMAELEGTIDTKEINLYGQLTLNWICVDPHVYKKQSVDYFTNGVAVINNTGSVETPPVYEVDVLDDITHLDIISGEKYFRIGEPTDVEKPAYNYKSLILHDTMKTMLPWSDATEVDNGYVTGSMIATQTGFKAELFGGALEPQAWQGPAKRRVIGSSGIKDFQVDVLIEFLNYSKETGMIEIYLLDAFSNTVAKIGFEDVWATIKRTQAKFQLGNVTGRTIEHHVSANGYSAWNDFKGMLRLVRRDNVYKPYFAVIKPDGSHDSRYVDYSYTDLSGDYAAEITQIQVAIRKWPGSSTSQADMTIRDIKVWRYNPPEAGTPYIAQAGDQIIVDTKEGVVLINGEVEAGLKDHFSDYFDLPAGKTRLVIQPEDKVSGKVTIRERSR